MATFATQISPATTHVAELPWLAQSSVSCIRVLTVDEHPLVREGLASVINKQPEMYVVAHASSGAEALRRYREHRPDVVTVDLHLPDMAGEEFIALLLREAPQARIVVITSSRGDVHILRALEAGVRGVVLKGMPNEEILASIRQVHAGRKIIPHEVASTLAEHLGEDALTPREVQVLRLVARGNRNKQVAALLSIADETVRMHMKNILSKLSANDRTHAVTIALTRGVIQL